MDLFSKYCKQHFLQNYKSHYDSAEECAILHIMTMAQSINLKWKKRHRRLTASDFGRIVRGKLETLPDNLLKYILGYYPTLTNSAIEWGRRHEEVAVDSYLLEARELHPRLSCQGGTLTWVSPNGLVYCPLCNPYHCEN